MSAYPKRTPATDDDEHGARRGTLARFAAAAILALVAFVLVQDAERARVAAIAAFCVTLWLTEAVPPHVPTLWLLLLVPLVLGGTRFDLPQVLEWTADPVLALFFGGFALGLAAQRHGIDGVVARLVVRAARGRRARLVFFVMAGTAGLSMWMSNIAAAAMMVAALRPLIATDAERSFRSALLLAIALGANVGGIATPIGTGPNAVAIAALERTSPITFLEWMAFALPLVGLLLAAGFALIAARYRVSGHFTAPIQRTEASVSSRWRALVVAIFAACVVLWLSEPFHGVPASLTALGAAAVLFGFGVLSRADWGRLDWSTLSLIAGGILLGRLLEASGLVLEFARNVDWYAYTPLTRTLAMVFASALLSALMSNTATAAMLIPLASALDSSAAAPVLVAIGCSLGFPFVISTPPNAMVYGAGVKSSELALLGLPLMLLGCALVGLTGAAILAAFGQG